MFAVGEFSFEALVWEDVADFRRVTAAVRTLEEWKEGTIQCNVVLFQRRSERVLGQRDHPH